MKTDEQIDKVIALIPDEGRCGSLITINNETN